MTRPSKAIGTIRSKAISILRDGIDTDILIPKNFLKTIQRTGFEDALFYPWRYDDKGQPKEDFPLNQAGAREAQILISGENFGSGSSREHAAWALQDFGFRVVIAGSYSPIFFNNWVNNINLPIVLEKKEREALAGLGPDEVIEVDLGGQVIRSSLGEIAFEIDPAIKAKLMAGRDSIDETLAYEEEISAYERRKAHA